MIAANKADADAFISVAGAGESADKILKEQLKAQPSYVTDAAYPIIDSLANGDTVVNVPMGLYALFRPSVQPYMISWFTYNPQAEIKKLAVPILIVQGTTDIQISVDDAKALAGANPKAKLAIIDGMNHVLKEADADREKNIAAYSNSDLPLAKKFTEEIISFIENLK